MQKHLEFMAAQLIDSPIETTRIFWREKLGLTTITQDGTLICRTTGRSKPMPRDKIKPPTESKVELMRRVTNELEWRYVDPEKRVEYLLNFFSSVDLAQIRDELKK